MAELRSRPVRPWRRSVGLALALLALAATLVGGSMQPASAIVGHDAASTADSPSLCAPGSVRLGATTSRDVYQFGRPVVMHSSITNVSSLRCSVWLGIDPGFSPSFDVTDAAGATVWDRCWFHDKPGACFMILVARTLEPGERISRSAVWDQRSGGPGDPPHQVPAGTYTLHSHYQNIRGEATLDFVIEP